MDNDSIVTRDQCAVCGGTAATHTPNSHSFVPLPSTVVPGRVGSLAEILGGPGANISNPSTDTLDQMVAANIDEAAPAMRAGGDHERRLVAALARLDSILEMLEGSAHAIDGTAANAGQASDRLAGTVTMIGRVGDRLDRLAPVPSADPDTGSIASRRQAALAPSPAPTGSPVVEAPAPGPGDTVEPDPAGG